MWNFFENALLHTLLFLNIRLLQMFTSVAIDFFSISCSLPQVFFVDYGNTHNIMDYNQLRNISESLLEIPFQVNLFI